MSGRMNWDRASQRDHVRSTTLQGPMKSAPSRLPSHKQVRLIARLSRELGVDPPRATSSRGASYVIESLQRRVQAARTARLRVDATVESARRSEDPG
jgi:hypothetical protein